MILIIHINYESQFLKKVIYFLIFLFFPFSFFFISPFISFFLSFFSLLLPYLYATASFQWFVNMILIIHINYESQFLKKVIYFLIFFFFLLFYFPFHFFLFSPSPSLSVRDGFFPVICEYDFNNPYKLWITIS
jgi:hypothetical protein